MNGNIATGVENKNAVTSHHPIGIDSLEGGRDVLQKRPLTPVPPMPPLTRGAVKPVDWARVYGARPADPRFDDEAAEANFQRLRSDGAHDLLLEFDSFVTLEARCGELHAKLLDFPHDARLLALYDGYAAAWEMCRGL